MYVSTGVERELEHKVTPFGCQTPSCFYLVGLVTVCCVCMNVGNEAVHIKSIYLL